MAQVVERSVPKDESGGGEDRDGDGEGKECRGRCRVSRRWGSTGPAGRGRWRSTPAGLPRRTRPRRHRRRAEDDRQKQGERGEFEGDGQRLGDGVGDRQAGTGGRAEVALQRVRPMKRRCTGSRRCRRARTRADRREGLAALLAGEGERRRRAARGCRAKTTIETRKSVTTDCRTRVSKYLAMGCPASNPRLLERNSERSPSARTLPHPSRADQAAAETCTPATSFPATT